MLYAFPSGEVSFALSSMPFSIAPDSKAWSEVTIRQNHMPRRQNNILYLNNYTAKILHLAY